MSTAVTSTPVRLSSWATRVVPANRSSAVVAPTARAIAPRTGTSVRLEPRYLITEVEVSRMNPRFSVLAAALVLAGASSAVAAGSPPSSSRGCADWRQYGYDANHSFSAAHG